MVIKRTENHNKYKANYADGVIMKRDFSYV